MAGYARMKTDLSGMFAMKADVHPIHEVLAVTPTPEWEPKTEADKQLADNLSKLSGSAADCLSTYKAPSGEVKVKFILNSQGVSDLQAYVLMGMQFPSDNSIFETKMPKSYFDAVSTIDSTIWQRTRDEFVKISNSCQTFHDQQLYKILNAASTTRDYARSAIHDLSQARFINLRENLLVLLDEKYRTTPPDQNYKDAAEIAKQTLKKLARDAKSSGDDINDIGNGLRAFSSNTMKLKEDVEALAASYNEKHTLSDGTKVTVGEMADSKHADIMEKLGKAQANEDEESKQMVTFKFFAAAFASSDSEGDKILGGAAHLMGDWKENHGVKEAREIVSGLDEKEKAIAKLVTYVGALKKEFDVIETSMGKAIKAIGDLNMLFDSQATCFKYLASNSIDIEKNLDETSYRGRCGRIIEGVDEIIGNLSKLQQSAEEFYKFHSQEKVKYQKFRIWD